MTVKTHHVLEIAMDKLDGNIFIVSGIANHIQIKIIESLIMRCMVRCRDMGYGHIIRFQFQISNHVTQNARS
jgi:hypothetical protein